MAVPDRLGDAEMKRMRRQLDQACYAGGTWTGRPLGETLIRLDEKPKKNVWPTPGLAGLYP